MLPGCFPGAPGKGRRPILANFSASWVFSGAFWEGYVGPREGPGADFVRLGGVLERLG